jgi:integrase
LKAAEIIGKLRPRQRILADSELVALWGATAGLSYPAGPFVRMLLLSGQQLREVAEMTWREIDFDKRLWTIPAERMKADGPHVVPLSPAAIEILKSLPRWHGDHVFSTTDGERPIANFSGIKEKVDSFMPGVEPWRFHDLRRTMRTALSALRVPDIVAELCIGHTQKGLHKTYDQYSYLDEKRRALDAWASRVLAIVEPGEPTNVISLAARG